MKRLENIDTSSDEFEKICKGIKEGKTCIYPTETCYGIGTNAILEGAVNKIYELKKRPRSKKLTCVVASLEQAKDYCYLSDIEEQICDEFMPGPLTLLADKKDNVPDTLNTKFAFRVPDSVIARKLPEVSGVPIVATSANISGMDNSYTVGDISNELVNDTDYVLDNGRLKEEKPSTIVSVENESVKILRRGPITSDDVENELGLDCEIV